MSVLEIKDWKKIEQLKIDMIFNNGIAPYHGIAVAKKNVGEQGKILEGQVGIITAYLPEELTFAIYYGHGSWYTFTVTEDWFLDHFKILQP